MIRNEALLTLPLIAALLLSGPGTAGANSPAPKPEELRKAQTLVRRLGDADFRVREQATRELFEMGLASKQALLEGSRNDDLEVRRRCRELLPDVLAADLRARIDGFLADREGKRAHDLPCWDRYRKLAGDDAPARRLFAEMLKGESLTFLEDVARDPARAGEAATSRCQDLQQRMYGNALRGGLPTLAPLEVPDIASVLLVLADPKVQAPTLQAYVVSNFLYQNSARAALTAAQPAPFRKLALAWMRRQMDNDAGVQQVLQMTQNLNLKEGLDLALEAARARKVKGMGLGVALITVGRLGTREHAALLEPFLDDNTNLGTFVLNTGRISTEVRDVALAMMVQLSGQDHKDYGFPFIRINPSLKFFPYYLGFNDAAQRDKAFKMWADRKAVGKKK